MNLKNHTLSKFLDNDNVKYPENLCKNILRFKEPNFIHNTNGKMVREINFYGKITNYLNNVNTIYNNSLFIGCNSFPIWDTITNEQREYVKSILNPNEDMKTYINNTLNELGLKEKEYDVIHVRCGDKFINSNIEWDVVLIAGNNMVPYNYVTDYCIKIYNCLTTTGYIVRNKYYSTLLNNYKEGVRNLMKEQTNSDFKIDKFWLSLQKKDSWYMIIPPTIIQKEDYSDIEKKVTNFKKYMLDFNKAIRK